MFSGLAPICLWLHVLRTEYGLRQLMKIDFAVVMYVPTTLSCLHIGRMVWWAMGDTVEAEVLYCIHFNSNCGWVGQVWTNLPYMCISYVQDDWVLALDTVGSIGCCWSYSTPYSMYGTCSKTNLKSKYMMLRTPYPNLPTGREDMDTITPPSIIERCLHESVHVNHIKVLYPLSHFRPRSARLRYRSIIV